jgi:predicted NUDIX family NTP pyrophosphohydrolase
MPKVSSGLLMYRVREGALEFLLVHPGGPFWKNKDAGAWTIPKGEVQSGEDLLVAARREFHEELGIEPNGIFDELKPVKQKGGKVVHAWAFEGDCDPEKCRSNLFQMEWPLGSGKQAEFPEVDKAAWFGMQEARVKINPAQIPFLDEIQDSLEWKKSS